MIHSRRPIAIVLAMGAFLFSGGCGESQPATGGSVEVPLIRQDTPESAARSLLQVLTAQVDAAQAADAATARRLTQLTVELADRDAILEALTKRAIYQSFTGKDPLEGFVAYWAPTVAFYADGFDLDSAAVVSTSAEGSAVVRVAANDPQGKRAIIELRLNRGSGGKWHIARLEFARPGVSIAPPTTARSAASSSAPAAPPP